MERSRTWSGNWARPRYQTDLPPGTLTWGPSIVRTLSVVYGREAMPWQRDLAAIGGALTTDGARMLYPYVVVHVPRRAGKSAGTFGVLTHRLFTGEGVRCHYTAQTREAAAKTFRDDWTPLVLRSPAYKAGHLRLRRSNGSEQVSVVADGVPVSGLSLFAPGPTALHGTDSDAAMVDEAWAFTADGGADLEAGIQPAQLTRPRAQLWIVSAGGTEDSAWLAHWMDLARVGTPGVALIDYGADPDDDPDDPAVWQRVHPAVGHTVTLDAIANLRATMPDGEFQRAILGRWTKRDDGPPAVIDPAAWAARLDPDAAPSGRIAYGVETAHDGARTTIVAASITDQGRVLVEAVADAPGTEWVPDYWRRLRQANRGRLFADSLGPTGAVVELLRRRRLPVDTLTTAQYSAACQAVVDDVTEGRLAHRGQPLLDGQVAQATARQVGDRWVWERRYRDLSAVVAMTVAVHGARRARSAPTTATATG